MAKTGFAGGLMDLARRFRSDTRGNIAIIFTLALVPIVSVIGCAVDYSQATRMKAKLQSAADAAAVASISQNSVGWLAASTMTTNGTVNVAVTDATNIFNGNLSTTTEGYSNLSLTGTTVTKTGAVLNSVVTFSATVPVTFMKVLGWQTLTVGGSSKANASLPLYLDFYLALDTSGSMGLPSTPQEALRLQTVNPDNFVQYPTGCTLACHFAPLNSACVDPPVTAPAAPPANPPITTTSYTQKYNTNNACMGFAYSRVSQSALNALIAKSSTGQYPKQVPGLPVQMLSGLPGSLNTDPNFGMTAATSCPTTGADGCIQLRLDAVGFALNATQAANGVDGMLALAQKNEIVSNQFRIGLYPFITDIDKSYSPLTTAITGTAISTAAANLASELDTNLNSTLGSGGTHIDNALNSINNLIGSVVGDGSAVTKTLPYIFLVTDGAQDNQYKDVPNGNWHGSNHATVLSDPVNSVFSTTICNTIKNRGIKIAVLYIPYQQISPVNTSFAGDEDDYANWNIPNISPSLSACASPPDAAGSYFYPASTPKQISDSLNAMFNHVLTTAHITN